MRWLHDDSPDAEQISINQFIIVAHIQPIILGRQRVKYKLLEFAKKKCINLSLFQHEPYWIVSLYL